MALKNIEEIEEHHGNDDFREGQRKLHWNWINENTNIFMCTVCITNNVNTFVTKHWNYMQHTL